MMDGIGAHTAKRKIKNDLTIISCASSFIACTDDKNYLFMKRKHNTNVISIKVKPKDIFISCS